MSESGPTHYNWSSIYEAVKPLEVDQPAAQQKNEFDNDAQTLENEKSRFQRMLASLNNKIRVNHLEHDSEGRDLFVLTVESIEFLSGIRNLFKDAGVRYDVDVGGYPVPIKNDDSGKLPLQNTVFISRIPLRKLNRSLFSTFLKSLFYVTTLLFVGATFYRIVLT